MKATLKTPVDKAPRIELGACIYGDWIRLAGGEIAVVFPTFGGPAVASIGYQILFDSAGRPASRTFHNPSQSELVVQLKVVVEVVG